MPASPGADRTSPRSISAVDREGARLLTLDRPEALNAFTPGMFVELAETLAEAAADPAVGCVVLTGNGRAFTAGSSLAAGEEEEPVASDDPYEDFMAALEAFPKPLVAAVNGLAVGIGTTMLGHCDLVLAAESARFRMPFTSLGLVPEAGSTATMPTLLGPQRAAHAFFTSNWIAAAEAAAAGLVWKVAPDAELLDQALAVAIEIAAQPVAALVATKRLLLAARLPAASASRRREDPVFRELLEGPAHQAALAAFRERRS